MGIIREASGMRYLTYMALCLCTLFFVYGCGASRQIAKSDAVAICEAETATTSETTNGQTEQEQAVSEQERDEEAVSVTTVYDTSRPADPATGMPPVKERITQRRRTSTKTRLQASAGSRQTQVRTERRETTEKSQAATVMETTTRRGVNGAQCILFAIGLLVAAGTVGGWLWRRFER